MNSTKDAHELHKGNSRVEEGGLKGIDPDGQPLIHYVTAAQL